MRLYITNDKITLVELINTHLLKLLLDKKIEIIINGNKRIGIVEGIELDDENDFILLKINDKNEMIPVLDETKARFGKELIVFETKNHTTVIEIIE